MRISRIQSVVALLLLGAAQEAPIRALTLKDPDRALPTGGTEVVVFADGQELRNGLDARVTSWFDGTAYLKVTDALRKEITERMAKALEGQVDFKKERLVWVRWQTSAPPAGTLKHETRDRHLVFYVQAPGEGVRGERADSHNDFFAVSVALTPLLEPHERPAKK
jgi:hypothetical protein